MERRLLMVDDEETILFAVSEYFAAAGCRVDCARTLEEAHRRLLDSPYDVVVTDLRLGGSEDRSGLRIVEEARRQLPAARIIVLTAYGSPRIEGEARRRGADAFLNKPEPLAELAAIALAAGHR